MLGKLSSKVAAWVIYHTFIFISRRVPFATFTQIWNMAYEAYCEAEWNRLKKQSLSTRLRQDEWVEGQGVQLNKQQLGQISLRPGLNAGLGEKLGRKVMH